MLRVQAGKKGESKIQRRCTLTCTFELEPFIKSGSLQTEALSCLPSISEHHPVPACASKLKHSTAPSNSQSAQNTASGSAMQFAANISEQQKKPFSAINSDINNPNHLVRRCVTAICQPIHKTIMSSLLPQPHSHWAQQPALLDGVNSPYYITDHNITHCKATRRVARRQTHASHAEPRSSSVSGTSDLRPLNVSFQSQFNQADALSQASTSYVSFKLDTLLQDMKQGSIDTAVESSCKGVVNGSLQEAFLLSDIPSRNMTSDASFRMPTTNPLQITTPQSNNLLHVKPVNNSTGSRLSAASMRLLTSYHPPELPQYFRQSMKTLRFKALINLSLMAMVTGGVLWLAWVGMIRVLTQLSGAYCRVSSKRTLLAGGGLVGMCVQGKVDSGVLMMIGVCALLLLAAAEVGFLLYWKLRYAHQNAAFKICQRRHELSSRLRSSSSRSHFKVQAAAAVATAAGRSSLGTVNRMQSLHMSNMSSSVSAHQANPVACKKQSQNRIIPSRVGGRIKVKVATKAAGPNRLAGRPLCRIPDVRSGLAAFQRLLKSDICDGLNLPAYLSAWFREAPTGSILRGNFAEFLTYAFLYRNISDLRWTGLRRLPELMVRAVEKRFRVVFQKGRSPDVKFMGHLKEDLRATYRPLLFYIVMEAITHLGRFILYTYGFRFSAINTASSGTCIISMECRGHQPRQLHYYLVNLLVQLLQKTMTSCVDILNKFCWWRQNYKQMTMSSACCLGPAVESISSSSPSSPSSSCTKQYGPVLVHTSSNFLHQDMWQSEAQLCNNRKATNYNDCQSSSDSTRQMTPIIFLHGVGCGLLMYSELLLLLAATGHPVLVLEHPHISMRFTPWAPDVPSADHVVERLLHLIDLWKLPAACIVAHSYGSLIASRLISVRPTAVQSVALIDPVCIGMFMPHLLRSFVYRYPTCLKDLVIWLVGRDLGAATFFCRRFFWTQLNLWPEDLPAGGRSLLVLHGRDRLMDVPAVLRWLSRMPCGALRPLVMYHKDMEHGGLLLNHDWQERIVSGIIEVMKQGTNVT
ncbi:hypothetical protein CEUSTIGMA_g12657.t1 [Chlamydomonas eustigma]|uniref:AB hydrolase-1 domain-containing protein n=1 Tax=Chlamydomonas eustigma TaxID=1157962 RepID=A0A250XQ88_9CHLO|nr:hypothetical protein CEUSTIGMA_g12657.t1 [Chlamydomonas eustigma]|eukprot:GAX85237.1 hypothetical protein CEUSTIGMA_g12657.t1 [Chlamydomonas eustigma]